MSGSRKWHGALACVLWASVIACFLTTGTTRHGGLRWPTCWILLGLVGIRSRSPRGQPCHCNLLFFNAWCFFGAASHFEAKKLPAEQTQCSAGLWTSAGHLLLLEVVSHDATMRKAYKESQRNTQPPPKKHVQFFSAGGDGHVKKLQQTPGTFLHNFLYFVLKMFLYDLMYMGLRLCMSFFCVFKRAKCAFQCSPAAQNRIWMVLVQVLPGSLIPLTVAPEPVPTQPSPS